MTNSTFKFAFLQMLSCYGMHGFTNSNFASNLNFKLI